MILLCISSADVRIALLHRRKLAHSQARSTGRLKQDVRNWRGHWFLVKKSWKILHACDKTFELVKYSFCPKGVDRYWWQTLYFISALNGIKSTKKIHVLERTRIHTCWKEGWPCLHQEIDPDRRIIRYSRFLWI